MLNDKNWNIFRCFFKVALSLVLICHFVPVSSFLVITIFDSWYFSSSHFIEKEEIVRIKWWQEVQSILLKSRDGFIFPKYMLHKCITSTAEIFQKMDNEVVSWARAELLAESCDSRFTKATGLHIRS